MSSLEMFSLQGKVALVTGGAGCYGRQMVEAVAEAGAETWVGSRNLTSLEALASELRQRGLSVKAICLDQGDEASVLAAKERILRESGRIDVLVNNAVARPMTQGFEDSAEAFAESMRVNATGLFIITRAFGDAMTDGGSIVNIGSIQGMVGPDAEIYKGFDFHGFYPDYFFHKGGMINFTRFAASYYGPRGIRVNCISPGGFRTDAHPAPFVQKYSERTFLGRMANDTDLKGVVVFLASDASAYITGANVPVDGGYTAK